MNPSESQSPLSEEQIRQRREEAARRQELQLRQQTQRIQEQRMRPVRPEKYGPGRSAPAAGATPAGVSPAGVSAPLPTVAPMPAPAAKAPAPAPVTVPLKGAKPSGIKVSGWVNAEKIAAELAAEQAAMEARAQTSVARKTTASVPAPPSSSIPEQSSAVAAPSQTAPPAKAAPVVLKMKVASVDLPPEPTGPPAPPMADGPQVAAAPSSIDDDEIRARRLAAELSAPARPTTVAADLPPPVEEATETPGAAPVGEQLPVLRMSTKPVSLPKSTANPGEELNAFQAKISPVENAGAAAGLPPPPVTRSTTSIPMVRALGGPEIAAEELRPPPPPTIALTGQKAPTVRIDKLDLDLADLPDVVCPKCQVVIPESHHGSFVAQCAKCGEVIKLK
jgi:hypothetical protein